ncbi:hypothetical protein A3A71_02380 [Candidatus Berkelbacteria bacterium RIFCSPLOWO2_01_FULL_50_28]|uniref:DUF302 domain-containing protein n=1 Tax=Candidatus Berkelbacteria bacterium RIFCSPLOWO2_01_FULL_50_28 TaxID=1797471 RepID=A0A1F5EBS5_9BACT|nr:MAG: hypothetical protein A2807_00775 [Candidatus Berkelbacteria bacterium RIFCSPHIGHO2_01_FULL_50_36]OGD62227.1 MAG: hypothetical protein A3F39_00795 [Candidatus Berkelbacteria bacterium RIFCSPHIGHO2_12_FULL_50_11]OGD64869.1 MAG: hypothetical protein A3A71_02380 [Candidatus Berkelbacteria bacterium RIFCSPLOWO2_01_FULL_50_28]
MDFDYTTTSSKDFDQAVQAVQDEVVKAGMRVLHIHDVQETLGNKGFKREPFKIIEFCNAKDAYDFLKIDIKIGLCLPCKINVYIKDGPASAEASAGKQTFISAMRPIILPQFFPDADFGERPKEIDQIIQGIVNNAK